jgi:hypothetical protein
MDKNVDKYIAKQSFPQKDICQKLRVIIMDTFPDIKEELRWDVPSYDDGKFYFVCLKTGVNLGFSVEGLSDEEKDLFDDGGKTTKHIKMYSMEQIDEERIGNLLRMVKNAKN